MSHSSDSTVPTSLQSKSAKPHPFDRYADFTDLAALNDYSQRPLRKCMRVNTLKMSVEDFRKYAKDNQWKLEPVPWSEEGFFIDRPLDSARGDKREALGKDILHLLGHTYIQEASSMLPVALLDPKPGEKILDMAAAPGSKSTQIAARMGNTGILIANDMQEARLHTLRGALTRLGVINVIMTKKMGQWFSKAMTARFDRVLIDAPCTGQGTSRKDPGALKYCSVDSIGKNAKLQRELLESAIHATRISGRIVYSTCTLTPEENEDVVLSVLSRFPNLVEVVDPRQLKMENGKWKMNQAIEDSIRVQKYLAKNNNFQLSALPSGEEGFSFPFLRIWPQTYDSEGFFCAVLKKTGPTRDIEKMEPLKQREELLRKLHIKEILSFLEDRFGRSFRTENEVLLERDGNIILTTEAAASFRLPVMRNAIGLPFGKVLTKAPIMLDHDLVTLRGITAATNIIDLTTDQWQQLLSGQNIDCDPALLGNVLLHYHGVCVGRARAFEGRAKNHLPRWMVQMFAA